MGILTNGLNVRRFWKSHMLARSGSLLPVHGCNLHGTPGFFAFYFAGSAEGRSQLLTTNASSLQALMRLHFLRFAANSVYDTLYCEFLCADALRHIVAVYYLHIGVACGAHSSSVTSSKHGWIPEVPLSAEHIGRISRGRAAGSQTRVITVGGYWLQGNGRANL